MGQYISKGLGSGLVGALLAFLIAGCGSSGGTSGAGSSGGQTPSVVIGQGAGDTLPPSVTTITNPNPGTFQPVGGIQGVVRDAVTGLPIVGAQVSISIPGASTFVTTVTTGASGQYSFANVPASSWSDGAVAPDGIVQFGELSAYTVTVNMAAVDAALPGSAAKYPEAAFGQAVVGFASFTDGNNPLLGGACPAGTATCAPSEGGSGASTPVSGLTTTLNFDIGRMTEAITGKVKDAQNGLGIANATVTLLDAAVLAGPVTPTPAPAPGPAAGGIRLSLTNPTVTTAADGTFTFSSVPAVHCFNVEAQAPGYTESGTLTIGPIAPVCTTGGGLTALVPATPASLGDLDGSGAISCAAGECLGAPGAGEILLAPSVPGVDVVPPYVAKADPADGADIDVTTATGKPKRPIVLTFSEPMQTDNGFTRPIVATVDFKGLPNPGPGVSGPDGVVETRTDWNTAGTVLTITPINNWQAGVTYGVFVGAKPAPLTPTSPLVDISGNPCCRCIPQNALGSTSVIVVPLAVCSGTPAPVSVGAVLGEPNPTPATLLFTTNNGPAPIDGPANVKLGANSADFNQSTATIQWDPRDDPKNPARAYEVYMSINSGDWQLIARTLPGGSPVTQLLSRSWSFDDALNVATPGTVGVNPGAPLTSATNPTTRVSPGFEILTPATAARRVLEGFIADVGDDVSAVATAVDVADGFADLSDNFGSAAQVRIAIATVNSNGVIGTLSSPVTVKDNSGPQTNGTAPAGSTPLPACSLAAPCPSPPAAGHFNPIATTWRGQVVQDLFTGTTLGPDGIPDTILIGLSEPLSAGTATCNINAIPPVPCTQYTLRQQDGTVPDRLKTSAITIVSATYDEIPGQDINGNGVLDKGSDVNGNGIKGNTFGNTFVWLRIQAVTAGGPVDIRSGDFVDITGVQDLVIPGNVNRTVDQSLVQNRLLDIQLPQVVSAVVTPRTTPLGTDTIVVTFSEPLLAFPSPLPAFGLRIAGVDCSTAVTVSPAFIAGASSVTLKVSSAVIPTCAVSRLAGDGTTTSDFIFFGAVTDLVGNPLNPTTPAGVPLPNRNAFIFSGTFPIGTFTVTSTTAIGALPLDTTAPQLTSVALTPGTTTAFITLTFSERLGSFTFVSATPTVAIRLTGPAPVPRVTCEVATAVDQDPSTPTTFQPFVIGDRTVTLSINVAGASTATGVAGTCNVGANLVTGDFIALGPGGTSPIVAPAAADVQGNPLDGTKDVAVFVGGAFVPGSQP